MKKNQNFPLFNLTVSMFSLALLLAPNPTAWAHEGHSHMAEDMDADRPPALSGESIFQLTSALTDSNGKSIALSSFRGKPSLISMIYTSCQAACPLITSDMQRIEKGLPSAMKGQVQFILVSLDPKRDTPAKLTEFAKAHSLDLKRWTLLTASEGAVRELAAVLGIKYKKDPSGDFSHSNVISVLDSDGKILHQQVGLRKDPKDSLRVLKELKKTGT